jgi:deoxyribonuclease-4
MRIGFVTPFSGNLKKLKERIAVSRGNTFQFFARSLRGGNLQKINPRFLGEFQEFLQKKNINPVIVHAPYSYNLSVYDTESIKMVLEDLELVDKFRSPYYVMNPGYFKKQHPIIALENVKKSLTEVLENTKWYGEILIKNMAGAGTELCSTLEEWNELISFHPQVKGALDLGRIFSAGYSFTTEDDAKAFIEEVEEKVCWDKIKVIYINDSDRGCGSQKNYYSGLGEGLIGYQGFEYLLSDETLKKKIWIVENQRDVIQIDNSIEYLLGFFDERGK